MLSDRSGPEGHGGRSVEADGGDSPGLVTAPSEAWDLGHAIGKVATSDGTELD
ncbi:hypothetical protein ACGFIF_38200 [Kribbella sp. NPDC049174]|uniref:hypothetical protein n=1 Tax=Kribbella sp. NPDC049174 TaxID=3364112 RepID=UPI003720A129